MNNGGPAFPVTMDAIERRGMTLLDYFAAKAMQGLMTQDGAGSYEAKDKARIAYNIAEAMLAEKAKREVNE